MTIDRPRAATIEDVAAAAGVSRAAVSKVLRDAYGVSDVMRERVTEAIAELGYRPRTAARAMRGRTFTIGIEIPDLANQFFPRLLTGAMRALAGTPYQVVIAPAEVDSRYGLRPIEALVDRQVDGVVVVSPQVVPEELERIARSTPVVMLGRHDEPSGYDIVDCDDEVGAGDAMRHLLSLGHRRTAHLTLHEANPGADQPHGVRLRRYLEMMRESGHAEAIEILRTDEGEMNAYRVVRQALADGSKATAIFAAHDELAIGALRAVAETEADISVVGYDDVPIASHPALGLTTVHQPGDLMGEQAVQLLLERISGRTEPRRVLFHPELRVRTSSRPAAVGA